MGLTIDNITKIFSTGFKRQAPSPTDKSTIDWSALGTMASKMSTYDAPKTITKNVLHSEYLKVLDDMYKTRLNYYDAIETIQNSDKTMEVVDKLIQMLVNVVAASTPFSPAILDIEPNAIQALRACKEFNERCDVYLYDRALLRRLIIYGEAFLGTAVQVGKGVVELNDLIEAKRILPCYKGFKVQEFIGFLDDFQGQAYVSAFSGAENKVRVDRNLMTHFVVDPQRHSLSDSDVPELMASGMSALVGTSVLYPALSRLYRLKTMEDSADAIATADALADKIVGIPLKDTVKPEDYPEIARTYTDFLRPILSTPTGNASTNVSTSTGSVRVLPYPSGQGKPEVLQFASTDSGSVETRIQALSDSIDKTLGTVANTGNRSQTFSAMDQLVKRLTDLVEARRRAWKEIYLRNLTFLGIYINPSSFDVKMEALPDYGIFSEAEGIAHLVDALKRLSDYFNDVKEKKIFKECDSACLVNIIEQFLGNRYPALKGMIRGGIQFKAEPQEPEGKDNGASNLGGFGDFGGSGDFDAGFPGEIDMGGPEIEMPEVEPEAVEPESEPAE